MFETLRKYGSVFMLLLASTLLLCLVAEEICDVQHWVKQDAHSSCLSYFAEDFDFDEEDDDEVIVKSSKEFDSRVAVPMCGIIRPEMALHAAITIPFCQLRNVVWIYSMPLFLSILLSS